MSRKTSIIVISDNHGREDVIMNVPVRHFNADYFFHCGDSEMPAHMLKNYACVRGNNDFDPEYAGDMVITVEQHRIFLTHGHRYFVAFGIEELKKAALRENCDIVIFGHTHRYTEIHEDGIWFLNPGSINRNRDGTPPSYLSLTLDGENVIPERMNYTF